MLDIIFLAQDLSDWRNRDQLKDLRERFPFVKVVEDYDIVTAHFKAAAIANTSFFYVIDAGYLPAPSFDFSYQPYEVDKGWAVRFMNDDGNFERGIRLFHKSAFAQTITDKAIQDFVHNFGNIGIKDAHADTALCNKVEYYPDLVFAARNLRDWSNRDQYARLKKRFPELKYVEDDDVVDLHFRANGKAHTSFFYVIDAGYEPNSMFEWFCQKKIPIEVDRGWVTRFMNDEASHEVGIRLFHKDAFRRSIRDKATSDFINNFGYVGVKDNDVELSSKVKVLPDIILLTHKFSKWKETYDKISKIRPVKVVHGDDVIKMHQEAAGISETSFFYVIDADYMPLDSFDFSIEPEPEDKLWVKRFDCGTHLHGIRLMHRDIVKQPNAEEVNYIHNWGSYGVKDLDIVAAKKVTVLLDIVFLDNGEPFADKHFNIVKERFGERVKRVSRVKGLLNAHAAAAATSTTSNFYVVDADSIPSEDFNFEFIPEVWERQYLYLWNSHCDLTGLTYGNAGVKLLNQSFFTKAPAVYVDLTTTIGHQIAKGIKIMPQIASKNMFYEDEYMAWRGAFREAAKLHAGIISGSIEEENKERLEAWKNIVSDHPNKTFVERGVKEGIEYVESNGDLSKLNNYDWLKEKYNG